MCKVRKLDCVAITDHDEIDAAITWKPFLEGRGIQVIVGEEIFSCDGEIIGLFLTDRVAPGLSAQETVRAIREQGGIVYVPHPYDEKRWKTVLKADALKAIVADVDCIEVHNGRNVSKRFDLRQKAIAEENGLMPIIGGDAHCFFEIGRNVCETDDVFTRESFSEMLENAVFKPSACLQVAHFVTKIARVIKMAGIPRCKEFVELTSDGVNWAATLLAERIARDYSPDVVVFLAKGGWQAGKAIADYFKVPLHCIQSHRSGDSAKEGASRLLAGLPRVVRHAMRSVELFVRTKHKSDRAKQADSMECFDGLSQFSNQRILLVDDSMDSGVSVKAALDLIGKEAPGCESRCAVLNAMAGSEENAHADYVLWNNVLLSTPASKDSEEYAGFIEAWQLKAAAV